MVTTTHFLEVDATEGNDLPLGAHYTHLLTEIGPVEAPSAAYGIPLTLTCAGYRQQWTFPDTVLTRAQFDSLITISTTEPVVGNTYPRLNVMDAYTPTFDVFTVRVTSLVDVSTAEPDGGEGVTSRRCTLVLTQRGTTGGFSFVVDSGGGNAATVTLDGLESVSQIIQISGKGIRETGADPLSVVAEPPMEATVTGWVATASLDKLQKVLDAVTAVEMVGAAFDTTGSGYFSTELPAATTAILESMVCDAKRGSLAHVTLRIVRDTTP